MFFWGHFFRDWDSTIGFHPPFWVHQGWRRDLEDVGVIFQEAEAGTLKHPQNAVLWSRWKDVYTCWLVINFPVILVGAKIWVARDDVVSDPK